MSNTKNPCCPDRVAELIANKATRFTEDDKDWLLNQSAETIEKLTPIEQEPKEAPAINKEQAMEVLKEDLSDKDKFMEMLPDEMRAQLDHGLKAYKAERDKLISDIVANSNEQFKAEDLKDEEMPMLQKLHKSLVKVDYSANGAEVPVNVNSGNEVEPLMPNAVETNEK